MTAPAQTCTATSDIGYQCSRVEGHDGPGDSNPAKNKANAKHIARNSDNMVLQIWGDKPES